MTTSKITELIGIDVPTLQKWLSEAQAALHSFRVGQKEVTVEITGGGQHRSVTFDKTNIAQLSIWISQLQRALGMRPRRRSALSVSF
jgi:hypothetical protein